MSEAAKDGAKANLTRRRLIYLSPALIFAVVAGYFLWGLNPERNPRVLPSVMIDKPAPEFDAPPLAGMDVPGLASADLRGGQVSLVNVFASWCIPCRAEHPLLMALAANTLGEFYDVTKAYDPDPTTWDPVTALNGDFKPEQHVGFEAAAWYWHFVDVVWLFLFACVYIWAG